jgi:hypothetical protein
VEFLGGSPSLDAAALPKPKKGPLSVKKPKNPQEGRIAVRATTEAPTVPPLIVPTPELPPLSAAAGERVGFLEAEELSTRFTLNLRVPWVGHVVIDLSRIFRRRKAS